MFSEGDRIEMVHMPDDPEPILSGARGTVREVQPGFQPGEVVLSVRWDNGRTLSVVMPPDQIIKVEDA